MSVANNLGTYSESKGRCFSDFFVKIRILLKFCQNV